MLPRAPGRTQLLLSSSLSFPFVILSVTLLASVFPAHVKAGVVLWSCIAPDGGRGCVVPRVVLPRNQGALWQHPAGEQGPREHPTTAAPAGKCLILSPRLSHGPHVVGVSLSGPSTCVWHRLIPIQKHTVLAPLPTAVRRREVVSSSFYCRSVSAVSSESICLIPWQQIWKVSSLSAVEMVLIFLISRPSCDKSAALQQMGYVACSCVPSCVPTLRAR